MTAETTKRRLSWLAVGSIPWGLACLALLPGAVVAARPGVASAALGLAVIGVLGAALANYQVWRDPERRWGRGFAWLGELIGLVAISAAMVTAGLMTVRDGLGYRARCSSNLTAIAKAMYVYAADYDGRFPIGAAPAKAGEYAAQLQADEAGYVRRSQQAAIAAPGNALGPLALLVQEGRVAPKQLVCLSDPFSGPWLRWKPALRVSYSLAYPWEADGAGGVQVAAWWRANTDASQPLLADMAPVNGTGNPPRAVELPNVRGVTNPNSLNHLGDGMEVLFGDAHVEWIRSPIVDPAAAGRTGVADNIYTRGTPTGGTPARPGIVPAAVGPGRDVIMVPLRDGTTGAVE